MLPEPYLTTFFPAVCDFGVFWRRVGEVQVAVIDTGGKPGAYSSHMHNTTFFTRFCWLHTDVRKQTHNVFLHARYAVTIVLPPPFPYAVNKVFYNFGLGLLS